MIKYRPHRGSLADAMAEYKEFDNIAEMLEHIVEDYNCAFDKSDISIGSSHGADNRIGWKSSRYVCTDRYGTEEYPIPQCIGMCDLGEEG